MRKILIGLIVLVGFFLVSADTGGGAAVPNSLNMPQRGEAARYPQDLILGELGQGQASDAAYAYTRTVLSALLNADTSAAALTDMDKSLTNRTLAALKSIGPEKYRIGGGREETGGGASFIFRFVGREQWIAGEVFVRFEDGRAAKDGEASDTAETSDAEKNSTGADAAKNGAVSETAASDAGKSASASDDTAPSPATAAKWVVDDIILDDAVRIGANAETYRYEFSPYERFF